MKLMKWDPLREVEDVFERFSKTLGWPKKAGEEVMVTNDWAPRADVLETDKDFVIKVEVPEVKKDDIKVLLENGVLSVKGERKMEKEEKDKKYHRVERYYDQFTRAFRMPDNVDEKNVNASFKDGILNITIQKKEKATPKGQEIKIT
jgi:HSP20 family protein